MTIKNINPFIRNAFTLTHSPLNTAVTCADSRIFYVFQGNGCLIIDEKIIEFKQDTLFLWQSGTNYKWEFSKTNIPILAVINFDYTQTHCDVSASLELITPDNTAHRILQTESFDDYDILNGLIQIDNAYMFKKNISEIIETRESSSILSKELSEAMLKSLIIKIVKHISENNFSVSKLAPFLEYIHANYNKEITNGELGEIFNYHPHYVNYLMKKYTGTTIHSYITQYRMSEAVKLLTHTDMAIETVAIATGYKNPSHFYKVFKAKFGISPSEYRKSITGV